MEHDGVAAIGGLYVIGTNRHESRRIDDQLRGRAGRQGDPGSSRFFISLEDDLIRRYGVMNLIPEKHRPSPGMTAVEDPIVAREIARAQRIVEGQNFEIRRTLWKYSALVEEQRRLVTDWRQSAADSRIGSRYLRRVVPGALRRVDPARGVGGGPKSRSGHRPARARRSLVRSSRVHRGHPRRHPPAAVRRARAGDGVPSADRGCVRAPDGGGAVGHRRAIPEGSGGERVDRRGRGGAGRLLSDVDLPCERQPLLDAGPVAPGEPQRRPRWRRGSHGGHLLAGDGDCSGFGAYTALASEAWPPAAVTA